MFKCVLFQPVNIGGLGDFRCSPEWSHRRTEPNLTWCWAERFKNEAYAEAQNKSVVSERSGSVSAAGLHWKAEAATTHWCFQQTGSSGPNIWTLQVSPPSSAETEPSN